jgi:ribosomal protein S18 acetylase RimI-like enzyme
VTAYDVVSRVTGSDADELWPVYDGVFGDQTDYAGWRAGLWDRHVTRAGFRLVRAYDDRALVGFAYGYTGERGQWWTDRMARLLDPGVAEDWLGGHFELVSIGVLQGQRGSGIGRELLRALTDGLDHDRWLLTTTADTDDPARHLYAAQGWEVIGPGLREGQVTMGRRRLTGA